uniref:Uncharacterized protein n=1 Tax=Triticum urartu TaxID=4572 RepID=A0A8R7PGP9_TRIUA
MGRCWNQLVRELQPAQRELHKAKGAAGASTTSCYHGAAWDVGTGSALSCNRDAQMLEPASVLAAIGIFLLELVAPGPRRHAAVCWNRHSGELQPAVRRATTSSARCYDQQRGGGEEREAASLIFAGTGNVDSYIRQFFFATTIDERERQGSCIDLCSVTRYDGGELQRGKMASYVLERDAEGCGMLRE